MSAWLGFERRVALRFLREGRMQTVLIIVGVAAGVAVIAYISALISGLQTNDLHRYLDAGGLPANTQRAPTHPHTAPQPQAAPAIDQPDPALRQQVLDIAQAHRETIIEPNRISDHIRGEPVPPEGYLLHHPPLTNGERFALD